MQHIIIIDASDGTAYITRREGQEDGLRAFERFCMEQDIREKDCDWMEVDQVIINL